MLLTLHFKLQDPLKSEASLVSGVGVLGQSLDKNKHTESLPPEYGSFGTSASAFSVVPEVNIWIIYIV